LAKLAVYDRSRRWVDDGFASAAAALAARCNMDRGVARHHVDVARKLRRLEGMRRALAAGEISRQHVSVITRAHTPERAEALEQLEPQLVEIARRVPPRGLREVVERVTDAIDGDDGASADEARYRRRRLHLSRSLEGMVYIDGVGDPESGAIQPTAITAEMERDCQANDPRTTEQRRFDALTNLCRRALDRGEVGTIRNARPHVSVVVDLAELEGRTPAVCAEVRNDAAHWGHVPRATLERLLCDCSPTRIIVDGPSQVLDVGRTTREISAALFNALVVRDEHCQERGCTRPWWECQVHHKWHVTAGGPTNLENTELLCWHHHRHRHQQLQRAGP
jgi:hypothetical protein